MHLDRILRSQGFGSKKECRWLIRHNKVTVAGQACEDPFAEFEPDEEEFEFTVDGVVWPWRQQATLILNKPAGYECSAVPKHHPSVLKLLPAPFLGRGVQPVGRLDEDTTGLLVFTDDGHLNHRLSSPKHKLPKVYHATCRHPISDEMLTVLLAGVQLHDEPAPIAAAAAEIVDANRLKLQAVINQEPLALIEYWAVDPDYDGKVFRSVWQDYRGNTANDADALRVVTQAMVTTATKPGPRKVCVRVVDVFGFEAEVIATVGVA